MSINQNKTIISDLKEQIEQLFIEELLPLLETQTILKELREKINSKPKINIDDLADALTYCYVASLVVAIGRFTDRDVRNLSLINFLNSLLDHADIFSQKWYEDQITPPKGHPHHGWKSAGGWYEIDKSSSEFQLNPISKPKTHQVGRRSADSIEEFFDDAGNLSMAMIRKDISSLHETTKIIKIYRNTVVAHGSRKAASKNNPTFNDLDSGILLLKNLVLKYYLLLKQSHIDASLGYLDNDWINLFSD